MRNYRSLLAILSVVNVLGSVACLIIMFISMNIGDLFWPTYIPIACSLFINAIIFAYVDNLGQRVDNIEDILKEKGIVQEKTKEKPQIREVQTEFRPGEPIKLKNDLKIDNKVFPQNASGIVIEKKENNVYVIEFDEERGVKYEVVGTNIKSYFDN